MQYLNLLGPEILCRKLALDSLLSATWHNIGYGTPMLTLTKDAGDCKVLTDSRTTDARGESAMWGLHSWARIHDTTKSIN